MMARPGVPSRNSRIDSQKASSSGVGWPRHGISTFGTRPLTTFSRISSMWLWMTPSSRMRVSSRLRDRKCTMFVEQLLGLLVGGTVDDALGVDDAVQAAE